jgi:hypothetical protein
MNATLYTAYIDTYLNKVDQLDNTTRAQLGPDYAFIFQYIYPRVYEIRIPNNAFVTIIGQLGELVNSTGSTSTGSTDTGSTNTGVTNTGTLQPLFGLSRVITASGQTLSWTTQNTSTIAWMSTGPNGTKV